MKIKYDSETDSIYLKFSDDEIVAVEILNVKSNPHEVDIPTILKSA
ncbi:DUF2283 domain-containing protein [Sulfurimonas sp. MAG313]|nr:hypothetical protein [Sulfurimonas sp. MAG313]MDF1880699.1 DUF2283 domain-containing protein [Sulfurimonas sp. MAG313]